MNSPGRPSHSPRVGDEGDPARSRGAAEGGRGFLGVLRTWAGRLLPRTGAKSGPSLFICLLLGFFAAALFLLIPQGPFESLDWKLYDLRLRWRNDLFPQPISRKIQVIGVDERDRYIYDNQIISRWAYAKLLESLRQHRVESVVFDIMFIHNRSQDDLFANDMHDVPTFLAVGFLSSRFRREPSVPPPSDLATMQDAVERTRTADEAWKAISRLRDYSETLDNVRRQLETAANPKPGAAEELGVRMAWVQYLIDEYLQKYYIARYSRPYPEGETGNPYDAVDFQLPSAPLLRAAEGAGFINTGQAEEEVVRRVPLVYGYGKGLYLFPSLDLVVMLRHYGATFAECKIRFGDDIEFPVHKNGSGTKRIPIDSRGEYLVNYRQGEEYLRRSGNKTLSFYTHPQYAALRKAADLDRALGGSIVLVGDTAQGSSDVHPIPLQPLFPLVGVHANVFDNILKNDYIHMAPSWLGVFLVFAMGGLIGLVFARYPSGRASRIAAGVLLLYLFGQFSLFLNYHNIVLPIARIVATAVGGYFFLVLYTVGVIERDRRLVKEVFLKSVSPRIGEEILQRFNDPSLWASRRSITVLFVDIRGFTSLSERLEPDKLVELLDLYYDTVSEIVFRHDGQVNKFIGDAVMALYGALPGEDANHAERALRTAVDIHLAIASLNARLHREGREEEFRVGVGVNTGEVVVGTVGRRKIRIEYTALGDTVNTAERLQGQAGGGRIYVGGDTVESLRVLAPRLADSVFRFTRVEGLTLKGKTRNVDVYECMFDATATPVPEKDTLEVSL